MAANNRPARQVSGDLYDAFVLDDDHFGLLVADVSDKGMPAPLYMALTRSLLRAEAYRERSPRIVLTNVNRLLLEMGRSKMFVSVFYGVVERESRRLTFARAGHERPLLYHRGKVQELQGQGMILGQFPSGNLNLTEKEIILTQGDRLLLYTDGLTDILSPDKEPFARDRLVSLLQTCGDRSPKEICSMVFDELTAFQKNAVQYDDMTMLVLGIEDSMTG